MQRYLLPQDRASAQKLLAPSRQRGWLGAAEFVRQQALLRVGRAALLPQAALPERRKMPRPLHKVLPSNREVFRPGPRSGN